MAPCEIRSLRAAHIAVRPPHVELLQNCSFYKKESEKKLIGIVNKLPSVLIMQKETVKKSQKREKMPYISFSLQV